MTPFHYLFLAYALIWLTVGFYVLALHRRIGKVQGDLQELRRRMEEDGDPGR